MRRKPTTQAADAYILRVSRMVCIADRSAVWKAYMAGAVWARRQAKRKAKR